MQKLQDIFKSSHRISYGIFLCIAIALAAIFLSSFIPFGAVAIAIILGIFIAAIFKPGDIFSKGISVSEKHILSFAIALMGIKLNFRILENLGLKSILLVIIALTITIISSQVLAKLFGINKKLALLIGIGNAVCGSSAIAASEKIIGAKEEEVALSIAVVNFLGTMGIFFLPFLAGAILNLSSLNSGILIGNTLQAVGQVVAAGFSMNDTVGQTATIVKMTRILMLFPLLLVLILLFTSKNKQEAKIKHPGIPKFIIGFILFSIIPTFNLLPANIIANIAKLSHYALIVAMSAIGLKITLKSILQKGRSALFIATVIFTIQIAFTTTIILLFFT